MKNIQHASFRISAHIFNLLITIPFIGLNIYAADLTGSTEQINTRSNTNIQNHQQEFNALGTFSDFQDRANNLEKNIRNIRPEEIEKLIDRINTVGLDKDMKDSYFNVLSSIISASFKAQRLDIAKTLIIEVKMKLGCLDLDKPISYLNDEDRKYFEMDLERLKASNGFFAKINEFVKDMVTTKPEDIANLIDSINTVGLDQDMRFFYINTLSNTISTSVEAGRSDLAKTVIEKIRTKFDCLSSQKILLFLSNKYTTDLVRNLEYENASNGFFAKINEFVKDMVTTKPEDIANLIDSINTVGLDENVKARYSNLLSSIISTSVKAERLDIAKTVIEKVRTKFDYVPSDNQLNIWNNEEITDLVRNLEYENAFDGFFVK